MDDIYDLTIIGVCLVLIVSVVMGFAFEVLNVEKKKHISSKKVVFDKQRFVKAVHGDKWLENKRNNFNRI